eukprot:TRINITY_DN41233_c0_g1_i1.p1 TRINITY_DN41233_c0_g1~~TRINITY_DN41233_c0_g1_i1.p1  ORF type:complete len:313 (+),score=70.66 TRINITY_DN41233_c0_g1_i1:97-1035(+)
MGRKRNTDAAVLETVPSCPSGHTLNRRVASDGDYECDVCSADMQEGTCFYGCTPCDYSLCGGCYVKLATGGLESTPILPGAELLLDPAAAAFAGAAAMLDDSSTRIDPDVADLCDHFGIEDRIMLKLNEAMKTRKESFQGDLEKLWEELKTARSPAGFLMSKVKQMNDGTYIGKVPPPPEVKRVIDKYRLDLDARSKLSDFILKRPHTAEQDLYEIERRLVGSGKPSAIVMTMIVKLHKGEPLPALFQNASHRDYGEVKKDGGAGGRDSNRGGAAASSSSRRSPRRSSRSRERRSRDRSRDRRDRSRSRRRR